MQEEHNRINVFPSLSILVQYRNAAFNAREIFLHKNNISQGVENEKLQH